MNSVFANMRRTWLRFLEQVRTFDITAWTAWLTLATVILAFTGFGTFVVAIRQLSVMSGQLDEMHSGGVDTHHLAEAAEKQAKALEGQLEVLKGQLNAVEFQLNPNIIVQPTPNPSLIPDIEQIGWNINYVDVGARDAQDFILSGYMSISGGPFYQSQAIPQTVLPSRTPAFTTLLSKDKFDIAQTQQLFTRDLQIRILVQISYADVVQGKKHDISRCWGRLRTGAIASLQADDCIKGISKADKQ